MNRSRCESEKGVLRALRTGLWSAELSSHAKSCASCRETRAVAGALLHYAASLPVEHAPGASGEIWRRAQTERQAMILKRATRPLIVMRLLSLGCVAVFAVWLMQGLSRFDLRRMVHGVALGGILPNVGLGVGVLCIAAGAFYLLHEGRRQRRLDVVS
jgi:hypothetical protein